VTSVIVLDTGPLGIITTPDSGRSGMCCLAAELACLRRTSRAARDRRLRITPGVAARRQAEWSSPPGYCGTHAGLRAPDDGGDAACGPAFGLSFASKAYLLPIFALLMPMLFWQRRRYLRLPWAIRWWSPQRMLATSAASSPHNAGRISCPECITPVASAPL